MPRSPGRLNTVTQGTGGTARTSTFIYNPQGFLQSITDPLSRTVSFTYDAAGRVLTQTLPDLRVIQTTYDANGNVASITPPSRPAHAFGYTPIDLEASYTPPDLGIGTVATSYTYNADRQLTAVTRPDGQTLTLDYEPTGGRLSTLTAPTGPTTFTYHPTSGNVTGIASPGGVGLGYTYDGSLLTGTTWTGPVAGSVNRTYDTDFRVATESVNGGNSVILQYDADSLLTGAGALTLTHHASHGLLTGTTLGSVTDSYTYSTFGELATYQTQYNGSTLLDITYTRDALGRITQKVETVGGVTTTTAYGYDPAGRLIDVTTNGTPSAHYDYDGNGNRLSVTRPGGTVTGTYDAQDRVVTYGAVTYTHNNNGDLLTSTSGGETTTYTSDVFGNLTAVTLPNTTTIEYLIDGQNRRIGKKVNNVLTQGFLYGSPPARSRGFVWTGPALIWFAVMALLAGCELDLGYYDADRAVAERAVAVFRNQFSARAFGAIYDQSAAEFRAAMDRDHTVAAMPASAERYGSLQSTKQVAAACFPHQVRLVYHTTFTKSDATEFFVWAVKKGKAALLLYRVTPGFIALPDAGTERCR